MAKLLNPLLKCPKRQQTSQQKRYRRVVVRSQLMVTTCVCEINEIRIVIGSKKLMNWKSYGSKTRVFIGRIMNDLILIYVFFAFCCDVNWLNQPFGISLRVNLHTNPITGFFSSARRLVVVMVTDLSPPAYSPQSLG